jgi:hypothetical protein
MADIMKMGKNPNYLGSWDLDELPNREATLTIAKIVDEKVVTNGQSEVCTVCYWTDANYKPMILNVTNKKTIAKLYHTKDTEKLAGKAVVVGVEKVKAFGDVHDALRIRKRIPKVEAAEKCADCGNDVTGAMGKSADYIATYTRKQFQGTCLCFDCAMKRKSATQQKGGAVDGQTEIDG